MNLLVTGGAGFIGSNFVEFAVGQGHRVLVLDKLTYAGHPKNLEGIRGSVELVEGDIQDPRLVPELLKRGQIDAVVHFAAESHVDRSITGPAAFIETNVLGTYNMLQASLAHYQSLNGPERERFRYLQVSTDEVYGALGETGKFTESTPMAPNSPYSASKASGDFLARAWHHTYGLPTITTNCSNNYGPKQFPEKLIPYMIQCALADRKLPVYGTGKNVRDWIHVQDHCQGVWLALTRGRVGATYLFGGNSERRNLDVVRAIAAELDRARPLPGGEKYESRIEFVADRPGHDWRYAIDDGLAVRELGFERRYRSFEEGLAATVRWYLENEAWSQAVLASAKAASAKGAKS
jgi:dTDP-glucose 4,6-dehydratase